MFRRLKQRFADMRTVSALCSTAEQHANADGQQEPGAEHFVLAALDLPDGTARRAFERLHADPARFREAIARQYDQALHSIGIASQYLDCVNSCAPALPRSKGLYKAKPSGQALFQRLTAQQKADPRNPLLGAHVIAAATGDPHGVVARALKAMDVDPNALGAAACAEVAATCEAA